MKKSIVAAVLSFVSVAANASDWFADGSDMISTVSGSQEVYDGSLGYSQLWLTKGMFFYVTHSKPADNACQRIGNGAMNDSPILVDNRPVPAVTQCFDGKLVTIIEDPSSGAWMANQFAKAKYVVVDGWKFGAMGFQKAASEMISGK